MLKKDLEILCMNLQRENHELKQKLEMSNASPDELLIKIEGLEKQLKESNEEWLEMDRRNQILANEVEELTEEIEMNMSYQSIADVLNQNYRDMMKERDHCLCMALEAEFSATTDPDKRREMELNYLIWDYAFGAFSDALYTMAYKDYSIPQAFANMLELNIEHDWKNCRGYDAIKSVCPDPLMVSLNLAEDFGYDL